MKSLRQQSDALAKRLNAIPAQILEEVRPALVASAEDVARIARALVPEDDGDLKASIAVTGPGETTPAYAANGGRRTAGDNQALVTVGNPSARHGHLVEFGTDPHVNGDQFEGTQHPGTDAQPFILPAARLAERKNKRRITRAVNKAVKKAAQGGGSDA